MKKVASLILIMTLMFVCDSFSMGWIPNPPAPQGETAFTNPVPVLLVHGLGGNSNGWNSYKRHLISAGFPENLIYTVDLSGSLCTDFTAKIHDTVNTIIDLTGFEKIDCVGHSRGARNIMQYIANDEGLDKIRNFVSVDGYLCGCGDLPAEVIGDIKYTSIVGYLGDCAKISGSDIVSTGKKYLSMLDHAAMITDSAVWQLIDVGIGAEF